MDTVMLFANPIAGRGRAAAVAQAIARALTLAGFDVRTVLDRPDRIDDTALAGANMARAAVVVGGDGTLLAVTQRLIDHLAAAHGEADQRDTYAIPPILLVPFGTANLMAQHLHIDWTLDGAGDADNAWLRRIVRAVAQRSVVHIDAASANGRLMLLVAGVGFDAHIAHEMQRLRTGPISKLSYAVPAVAAFRGYTYEPIAVEIDSQPAFASAPAMAFIGNIGEYGTGFSILSQARSDDGLLDVCVMPCSSRAQLVRLFLLVMAGEHIGAEGVLYTRARHVRVTSSQPVPVQIDGEASGHTPLEIEMLTRRIPFVSA